MRTLIVDERGNMSIDEVPVPEYGDYQALVKMINGAFKGMTFESEFPRKKKEGEANNQVREWLRAGVITLKEFISDYADFNDIIDVYDRAEKRQTALKCVIKF